MIKFKYMKILEIKFQISKIVMSKKNKSDFINMNIFKYL